MAYNKTVYVNDSTPAISAENLNKSEQGIFLASKQADVSNASKMEENNSFFSLKKATEGLYDVTTHSVTPSPAFSYINYTLNNEKILYITGYAATNPQKYPLYAFFDSGNNLIEEYGEQNIAYQRVAAVVPQNAAYVIVEGYNGSTGQLPVIEKKIGNNPGLLQTLTEATSKLMTKVVITDSRFSIESGLINTFGNMYSGNEHGILNVSNMKGNLISANGRSATISTGVYYPAFIFYDSGNNVIECYGTETNTSYTDYLLRVPDNANQLIINYGSSIGHPSVSELVSVKDIPSIWSDKKIGIIGTSTAFGALATNSWGYEASSILGYELNMFAVPGLAIETKNDGTPKTYGSLSLSKQEYASYGITIPDVPLPYSPGGSYNDYYRCYDNIFCEENADIDLWVFAPVPNNSNFDLDDWNLFNKNTWQYSDSSNFSDHRKTFIGALLFLMDKMYTLNPDARMVFVVDSSFSYSGGLSNLELLSEQWNIPIINLWGKINIAPPSLVKLKAQGGTDQHPSTFAQTIMGKMFAGEMNLIS